MFKNEKKQVVTIFNNIDTVTIQVVPLEHQDVRELNL